MAHLVESMAYVGAQPWHRLGQSLSPHQPIEVWQKEAGMDWQIKETPVLYSPETPYLQALESSQDHKVLYRSDTLTPLSVVSNRYKVVQPHEVLEFYRDLVEAGGFELETAGVLKGGRKLWALAKTGQETMVRGHDRVKAYLLLATSCDGTLCTTAQFTSVRVVCNNTLHVAVGDTKGAVKVPHSRKFDPQDVKNTLGLGLSHWESFISNIRQLAEQPINKFEAMNYLVSVLGDTDVPLNAQTSGRTIQKVFNLYNGEAVGSHLPAAKGTCWGLLNSITEYVDHHRRARSDDYRTDSAWFGQGALIKERAFHEALKLAA